MAKLYSSRHILSVLAKKGFIQIDQSGSHIKLRKDGVTVIVPAAKKEIPMGTFMSIVRQSQLSKQDFE
ncbi:MAG TPA: type II toxin-antitoxin system HicA family toxin [Spirochaetota bacterium]|nr:type II toxin-antitoxin system HicA family toxin [Spirochaetota bacterium]HPJ39215.1 type II toxin-antitoxin system HicA family toxin [Spirochaetota bacterium]